MLTLPFPLCLFVFLQGIEHKVGVLVGRGRASVGAKTCSLDVPVAARGEEEIVHAAIYCMLPSRRDCKAAGRVFSVVG